MRKYVVLCFVLVSVLVSHVAAAQDSAPAAPANPQVKSAMAFYGYMKNNVLKTADKIPADLYKFKATPDVRSIGQLLAHIADAQFAFCGIVSTGKAVDNKVEENFTGKADIVKALKDSFALCDDNYAAMTDENSSDIVVFRGPVTKLGLMSFNTAHGLEHYGNLVVYMRINKIVPPSSEEAPPPAKPAKAPGN